MVGAELEVHIAPLGDLGGVLYGLGPVGEEGCHLLFALDIELLGLEAHPVGVLNGAAHLDAHENILEGGIGPGEVVGVVGDHQRDPGLFVELQQAPGGVFLFRDAVVLKFQIVVLRAEDIQHLQGVGLGPFVISRQDAGGDLARQAGRQGDKPLVVLFEKLHVHSGFAVETLGEGPAHQSAQVPVAGVVLAQKDQMPGAVVLVSVEAGPGGHVDLAADDGLDACGLGGLIEIHRPVHDPVVGDRNGGLPQFLGTLNKPLDAAGAVQEAELRVNVQVDKCHRLTPAPSGSPPRSPWRRG